MEQIPIQLQLVASHLNPGLHSPIAADNDLASQWVKPTSEKIANAIVIRAAKKRAPIQFIVAASFRGLFTPQDIIASRIQCCHASAAVCVPGGLPGDAEVWQARAELQDSDRRATPIYVLQRNSAPAWFYLIGIVAASARAALAGNSTLDNFHPVLPSK